MTTTTVRIDPRFRARRVAVMRAEGRRRLRIVVAVMAVVATAATLWALTRSPVLDVDEVSVTGVDRATAVQLRDLAGVPRGVPLIDIDAAAIEARLERLPWIEDADVDRSWPDTISINVTRRHPVALVPSGSGVALLDEDAVVIARESGPEPDTAGLPMIAMPLSVAVGEPHIDAAPGLAVVAALTADLGPWVETVTVDDGRVGVDLVGGVTVRMGPAVRLDDKVTAVRAVLAGVELGCIASIDVTAPDQTMIRRNGLCDAVSGAIDG